MAPTLPTAQGAHISQGTGIGPDDVMSEQRTRDCDPGAVRRHDDDDCSRFTLLAPLTIVVASTGDSASFRLSDADDRCAGHGRAPWFDPDHTLTLAVPAEQLANVCSDDDDSRDTGVSPLAGVVGSPTPTPMPTSTPSAVPSGNCGGASGVTPLAGQTFPPGITPTPAPTPTQCPGQSTNIFIVAVERREHDGDDRTRIVPIQGPATLENGELDFADANNPFVTGNRTVFRFYLATFTGANPPQT